MYAIRYKGEVSVIVEASNGKFFIIKESGKMEEVADRLFMVDEALSINDNEFAEWLKANYRYNKPTDEWIGKDGKRATESYLKIKYSINALSELRGN